VIRVPMTERETATVLAALRGQQPATEAEAAEYERVANLVEFHRSLQRPEVPR